MDVLREIDRVTSLCPCGADPRPGSAYCSDDCVPTWRGEHTISDVDGTAMRWRPDLVTEDDDTGRTLLQEFRRGPYRAQMFDIADTDSVHCRLDDGHRYVGIDADGMRGADDLEPVWQRLEREMGNSRRLDPEPATCPCGCGGAFAQAGIAAYFDRWMRDAVTAADEDLRTLQLLRNGATDPRLDDTVFAVLQQQGIALEPTPAGETVTLARFDSAALELPDGPLLDALVEAEAEARLRENARNLAEARGFDRAAAAARLGNGPAGGPRVISLYVAEPSPETAEALRSAMESMRTGMQALLVGAARALQPLRDLVDRGESAEHPLTRVAAQRRDQTHGPQRPQRPPRRLGPR